MFSIFPSLCEGAHNKVASAGFCSHALAVQGECLLCSVIDHVILLSHKKRVHSVFDAFEALRLFCSRTVLGRCLGVVFLMYACVEE